MYIVWTKEEYADGWIKGESGTLAEVKEYILRAVKGGKEICLCEEVEFSHEITIGKPTEPPKSPVKEPVTWETVRAKEEVKVEDTESKPKSSKSA